MSMVMKFKDAWLNFIGSRPIQLPFAGGRSRSRIPGPHNPPGTKIARMMRAGSCTLRGRVSNGKDYP